MATRSSTGPALASAAYGLLVLVGAATLGFVVAPFLGMATGLFTIDAEARGFFSLLTLKGVPYLVGLSAFSCLWYHRIAAWRLRRRALVFILNVLGVWLVAGSIALAILG